MNKSQIKYMTDALFEAYIDGVYDKELKRGRDEWEYSAKVALKKIEERKTKVKVTAHINYFKRPNPRIMIMGYRGFGLKRYGVDAEHCRMVKSNWNSASDKCWTEHKR